MNHIGLQLVITEKRRSKEFFSSSLDGIEGLGPKLKGNLIRYFGGINKVFDASLDDLKSVPENWKTKLKIFFSSKTT